MALIKNILSQERHLFTINTATAGILKVALYTDEHTWQIKVTTSGSQIFYECRLQRSENLDNIDQFLKEKSSISWVIPQTLWYRETQCLPIWHNHSPADKLSDLLSGLHMVFLLQVCLRSILAFCWELVSLC